MYFYKQSRQQSTSGHGGIQYPKSDPMSTIHGTLQVQMVQQEQLCEGTPGGVHQQHSDPVLLKTNSKKATEVGFWPLNH